MQTFLPYPDYRQTAGCLDNSRLGNQCYRECKTLVTGGWPNHPAARMWRGYEGELCQYAYSLAIEITMRGHWKPDVGPRWMKYWREKELEFSYTGKPPWLGDPDFHLMHRRVLLAKDYDHYSQFWPELEPAEKINGSWPYIWPV